MLTYLPCKPTAGGVAAFQHCNIPRYHPYNQTEKTAEIQRFIDDDLGLDVASLDRDWRNLGL